MKSAFFYQVLGLCSFLISTASMLSDTYEATFGGLIPRTLTNLQTFTGALGGAVASPITDSGNPARPFEVQGDTFPDFASASTRSCDNQHNICADLANNGTGSFTVSQCSDQETTCLAAQSTATTNFQVLVSQNAQFDFICDS